MMHLSLSRILATGVILVFSACAETEPESVASDTADYAIDSRPDIAAELPLGLGRVPTAEEINRLDIDIMPDGHGLPPGSGSVAEGSALFQIRCSACHGTEGEGTAAGDRLVRDPAQPEFPDSASPGSAITVGNYWPYATTLFDYVRRAMPLDRPGSLTADEVYALSAYLLFRNGIVPELTTLDSASLAAVQMPARDRFVADDRLESSDVR